MDKTNSDNVILTIAIPTYNRAEFLERALNSIYGQIYDGVEVLISDNFSTDNTQKVVEKFIDKYSNLLYIRNVENIGPDANFLQCYQKATGKYVLLLGDDDLVAENSLNGLIDLLQSNNYSLIFINHAGFYGKYLGLENCVTPFLNVDKIIETYDKQEFINYAKYQLTYMSSFILKRDLFKNVDSPKRFNGTGFIHACIAFEATKSVDEKFCIYPYVCVAQDRTFGNSIMDIQPYRIIKVFGYGMEYAYCKVAVECGYPKKIMESIFTANCKKSFRTAILRSKINKDNAWKKEYKVYVEPIIKKYKKLRLPVTIYKLCPRIIALFIYNIIRPLYKKLKKY